MGYLFGLVGGTLSIWTLILIILVILLAVAIIKN